MNIKIFFCILPIIYVSTTQAMFENRKMIQYGSQAHECLKRLGKATKKADFFSEDFKQIIEKTNNPKEVFIELGQNIAAICYLVTSRPSQPEVTQLLKNLKHKESCATVDDLVCMFKVASCYGEPALNNNQISSLHSEPTENREGSFISLSFYKTALDNVYSKIHFMAEKNQWTKKQIEDEKKHFNQKLTTFIKLQKEK